MVKFKISFIALIFFLLTGCKSHTPEPIFKVSFPRLETGNISSTANPTPESISTSAPVVASDPIELTATVWEDLPKVPVLMYHRFDPQPGAISYLYTTSLTDFQAHLTSLYEAGFSLISLNDWINGDIYLQKGRRPLIITIDDLFYADQISLDKNGDPAPYSGVGILWQFSKTYPDFNFAVALFFNLGDKGYANFYQDGIFTIGDGWRQARAEAIAWSVEHGAMPLNHFYKHPFLNQLSPEEILWQIQENDTGLREALIQADKEDLIQNLPNILALPYVIWPATEAGEQVLYSYINPEGVPVAAIVEGDYAGGDKYLRAPFDDAYSRWNIPRISVSNQAIATIVEQADQIPTSSTCKLGEFNNNPHIGSDEVSNAILVQINANNCPFGYYLVDKFVFFVQKDNITQLVP